jgi:hypothetical protein
MHSFQWEILVRCRGFGRIACISFFSIRPIRLDQQFVDDKIAARIHEVLATLI